MVLPLPRAKTLAAESSGWVAGGPGGVTYEDVNGRWVDLNGNVVSVRQGPVATASGIMLSPKVKVYTAQGKLLGIWDRRALFMGLPAGTYFVSPVSGEGRRIARFSVCENEMRR
jgi:hypothetical protein